MKTKYDTEISVDIIEKNMKRLINQTYKLLPSREEGLDWLTPLSTVIEEWAGMDALFQGRLGENSLTLLSKLEGLKTIDENDFFSFRRTIFECLNLMSKVRKDVKFR